MLDYITTKTAVKKYFGISYLEYALAAAIEWRGTNSYKYRRGNGYGEYSYQDMSEDHDITRRGIIKAIQRLKKTGIIEINPKNKSQKRVTTKWQKAHVYNEQDKLRIGEKLGEQSSLSSEQSSPEVVNKVHQREGTKFTSSSELSSPHTIYRVSKELVRVNNDYSEKNKSTDNEYLREEKNENYFPPNPPKPEREFSAIMMAQKSYEKAREIFQKEKGLQPDVFSWEPKTISELEKVTVRLKEKMRVNGRAWEHDKDFTQKYLAPFFEAAATSSFWFNPIFSIGIMANRFADTYDEIIMQKNGNTKAATTKDPNADLISPEDATRATFNVIERMRRKRERRAS